MDVSQTYYTSQWQNLHVLDTAQLCDYYSFYENDSTILQQAARIEHLYRHIIMHLCASIRTNKRKNGVFNNFKKFSA